MKQDYSALSEVYSVVYAAEVRRGEYPTVARTRAREATLAFFNVLKEVESGHV